MYVVLRSVTEKERNRDREREPPNAWLQYRPLRPTPENSCGPSGNSCHDKNIVPDTFRTTANMAHGAPLLNAVNDGACFQRHHMLKALTASANVTVIRCFQVETRKRREQSTQKKTPTDETAATGVAVFDVDERLYYTILYTYVLWTTDIHCYTELYIYIASRVYGQTYLPLITREQRLLQIDISVLDCYCWCWCCRCPLYYRHIQYMTPTH